MFKQRCFRLLLLASAIATSLSAAAYDFESAGIYYNITGNNTVEVTYSDITNNTYYSGSISVPKTVTNNGTEYSVTKIGGYAFKGSAVTSVSMPEGITSIGFEAFFVCQNLETVALPESLTTFGSEAFRSCSSLKTIKIPSGVTAIPESCFDGCSSLKSVTIPEGVTDIGGAAFSGCNLNALTLPESLEKIKGRAFEDNRSLKSVNIPAKVKTIETQAFYGCGLTDLVIQEGVQAIGNNAFLENNKLKSIICNAATPPALGENAFNIEITPSIKVPMASIAAYRKAYGWKDFSNYYSGEVVADGITYRIDENGAMVAVAEASLIEANILSSVEFEGNQYPVIKINNGVFSGNTNLESVALPESLTTLGSGTFSYCSSLKTINIPSKVTAIPDNCLIECSSLESVTIPEGVTTIGKSAFFGCNLNALTLPESLETIGSYAFRNNSSLKSVNIPAKVKTIGTQAFYNCGLTELVIQEGVQAIGSSAFYRNSLQKLMLPSTITSIGNEAFYRNNNLESIICNAATPPALGVKAIGSSVKEIKVPISSIAAYKQANGWKDFTNYYGGDVVNNGITYRIDENGATITAAEATLTEANIPSAVEFEGNQYPVIKINDNVFADNTNLTAVTLPDGLVEIGNYAFSDCI